MVCAGRNGPQTIRALALNHANAELIAKALCRQSAFGHDAAKDFMLREGIGEAVARRILAVRNVQRQRPPA